MIRTDRGLLDTSVLIASETGRTLDRDLAPPDVAISVITLAELHAGVLAAADLATRAQRLRTLDSVADLTIIPIGEQVAEEWARLRVFLAERGRRVGVNDLWIAATAAAHHLPVVTQDDDFAELADAPGVAVVRV